MHIQETGVLLDLYLMSACVGMFIDERKRCSFVLLFRPLMKLTLQTYKMLMISQAPRTACEVIFLEIFNV